MTQETVRQIEDSIQRDKQHIALNNALDRLESNRDFKAVIIEGYLEKEAIRLVHLKSAPFMQTAEKQASVISQIDAIGGLMAYFRTLSHNAAQAAASIESAQAAIEELLSEEKGDV